ncbi:MAG: winged helix-turn-helix transcriptional regulator [Patescibacteria group bacterium]
MNYILLILVAMAGIILGGYFGARKHDPKLLKIIGRGGLIFGQAKKKEKNKSKILEFLNSNEKITNNQAEKLLKVSDSTAERYLNELEKEQKIKQIGTVGQGVYYRLPR